ncbi:hypothetical protein CsSME_00000995 [Camellia sinensis var. sinensis]
MLLPLMLIFEIKQSYESKRIWELKERHRDYRDKELDSYIEIRLTDYESIQIFINSRSKFSNLHQQSIKIFISSSKWESSEREWRVE